MSPSMRDKYRSKKFNIIPFIPQKEFLVEAEEEAQAPETVLMSASTLIFPLKSRQFTLRIVIAIITLHQLGYSLKRFKSLHLPEGEPILRYDTGMLSRALLTPYTVIYLLFNILHAVLVAGGGGSFHLPDGFPIGSALTSQLAIVLFYATLLSIIAYRQKIQLNPAQNILNLKAVLDGTLLVTILALGIAQDAVFVSLASLNVAVSSFMARARLSKANIRDRIINICAFAVSPIVVCGGIFGIIDVGIEFQVPLLSVELSDGLLIAAVVILGIVSIATVHCCLLMGAPPKLPKSDKGAASEKKV
ncbi:hypothetical protein AGABI1DRAFT_89902 [Agaricus bisporus var. burnettii JB137-S8]|uniref:Uncharacterized protein n=1 Tax=Agaricus bisporus var. burnettii (strain JB137-S8 / ATCC MYA-4627 / FGSC 10392) TaxID=597362 RepID=K5W3Q2_AGABU|nr:uncharacterized protein AGABI1DRAFT_89902 [Agaricus bisporus var. burnettii JB137-S8]EKM81424.1 hypothetical protein AGABI1DRAFT_89902 [Agaricus bisporus var. burnettii JB137-S8]